KSFRSNAHRDFRPWRHNRSSSFSNWSFWVETSNCASFTFKGASSGSSIMSTDADKRSATQKARSCEQCAGAQNEQLQQSGNAGHRSMMARVAVPLSAAPGSRLAVGLIRLKQLV